MSGRIQVLFVGHRSEHTETLAAYLGGQPWFAVRRAWSIAGDRPEWSAAADGQADIVVLSLSENWQGSFDTMPALGSDLLVVGPGSDTAAIRAAMKSGARDFLSCPVSEEELSQALRQIGGDRRNQGREGRANDMVAVIGARGGAGASFIATSLAHIMTVNDQQHVALVDMDLQFGTQTLNLEMEVEHGLSEVLRMTKRLDAVALPGYMTRHDSGLCLLAELEDNLVLPGEIVDEDLDRLFDLLKIGFDYTIVDLPRQIDVVFSSVMGKAGHILLTMEQSVAHVRDIKRLLGILTREFAVPTEQITVLVNRYSDKSSISLEAISETIDHERLVSLPNDYRRAMGAVDSAKPIYSYAPGVPLTRALIDLSRRLRGEQVPQVPFLERMFGKLKAG